MSEASEPVPSSAADETKASSGGRMRLVLLPLIVFGAIAALFLIRLFAGDPSHLPSALIGREVPHFDLPPVAGLKDRPGLSDADLRQGHVTVVNVFASWCGPCQQENPQLLALSQNPALQKNGIQLVGIAYKDKPENTRRFLGEAGNPYARIGADVSGLTGIDFGVYGVPETYIVKGNGKIAYKYVGPLTAETIASTLLPQIAKAQQP